MFDFIYRLKQCFRFAKSHSCQYRYWQEDAYLRGWVFYYNLKHFLWAFIKAYRHPVHGVHSPYWDRDTKCIRIPDKNLLNWKNEKEYWTPPWKKQ